MMGTGSFPELLKQSRERWGLDEATAAAMFGLSVFEWGDLESHDDEWATVTPAITIEKIVNFFGIDWHTCISLPTGRPFDASMPMDQLCRLVREQSGLSREDFADRVGFYPAFCEVIEGHIHGLSLYPITVATELASVAGIDAQALVEKILAPSPAFRAPLRPTIPQFETHNE